MTANERDALRNDIINQLMEVFPTAKRVTCGLAYYSDKIDEDTGMLIPVEIKITLKNTADTDKSKAYDLEYEAKKFESRPGRKIANYEKIQEKEKEKAITFQKKQHYLTLLRTHFLSSPPDHIPAATIWSKIPDVRDNLTVLQLGVLLKVLCESGELDFCYDDKKRKLFFIPKFVAR